MNGGRGRALPILEQNRPRVNSGTCVHKGHPPFSFRFPFRIRRNSLPFREGNSVCPYGFSGFLSKDAAKAFSAMANR